MKRILIVLIFIFAVAFPITVYGADIRLVIDGQEIHNLSAPPVMVDERVMVPARDVFERVGGVVGWHGGHRQVSVFHGDDVLVMTVGLREARLNGESIMMQLAPIMVNDRTLIPLRFPAEAFGLCVDWCNETRTAIVNSQGDENGNESLLPPISEIPIIPLPPQNGYANGMPIITLPPSGGEPGDEIYVSDKEELPWEGAPNELPPPGVTVATPEYNPDLAIDVSTAPIQTIPHPETTITALQTPRETGTAAYVIVASLPITGVNYFLLPDNRLVVDIQNAVSLISGVHYVDASVPISGVRASQFSNTAPRVTRVVFDVVGPAEFSVSLSADRQVLTVAFSRNRITNIIAQSDAFSDSLLIQGDVLPSIRISTEGFPQFLTINIDNASMATAGGFVPGGVFASHFTTGQRADGTAYINVHVGENWPSFSIAHSTNSVAFVLHHGITGVRYDSTRRELLISRDFAMDINHVRHIDEYLRYRYTIVLPSSAEVLGRGELSVLDGYINSVNISRATDGNVLLTFNTARVLTFSVHENANYFVIRAHLPREVFPFIVVIDPGHGGACPGAIHNGIVEKDYVLALSHKVMQLLDADPFIRAYMTRHDDSTVANLRRAEIANGIGADLFVSVHVNAVPPHLLHVHGIETWYSVSQLEQANPNNVMNSRQLANIMQRHKIEQTGAHDRRLFVGNDFVVLRETEMPAVLLEVGFITNVYEAARMATAQYQWQLAQAIYNGIVEAFAAHPPRR
ncbi:MAG: N-acetylmuramoyl-L-alanine amidase family protein [Defluviitaleaceae bacterium]|nr:N-acetylmuramoyl-L-alanine amidase family protein [Defluviitaleaceae bacterium]